MTSRAADGIEERANGAFAVRAGDGDDTLVRRGEVEGGEEALRVLEAELDPETLGAEKPGERFLV